MVRPIALASLALILPVSVDAQGRMMPAAAHAVPAAPRAVPHAEQAMVSQPIPAARVTARTAPLRLRVSAAPAGRISRRHTGMRREVSEAATADFIPVPGLGFDMAHVAATRGPEAVGAGRHRRQQQIF